MMADALSKALFLDRDGVINVDHGYVCTVERTEFVEGIFELCRAARMQGYLTVVVTNQSGIARGYYTEQDFHVYMDWMRSEFAARGAPLDAVYYCPHHPDTGSQEYRRDCECRKPKPGMLRRAAQELGLDLAASIMLGDSLTDMEAARAAGVGTRILFARHSHTEDASTEFAKVESLEQVLCRLRPCDLPQE